jgi:hypothetical protein
VHGLIASSPSGDWTYGAAILTFAFPVTLFIVVGSALYILYTKPHLVPGHKYNVVLSSVSDTPVAGTPGAVGGPAVPPAASPPASTAEQPPATDAEG